MSEGKGRGEGRGVHRKGVVYSQSIQVTSNLISPPQTVQTGGQFTQSRDSYTDRFTLTVTVPVRMAACLCHLRMLGQSSQAAGSGLDGSISTETLIYFNMCAAAAKRSAHYSTDQCLVSLRYHTKKIKSRGVNFQTKKHRAAFKERHTQTHFLFMY